MEEEEEVTSPLSPPFWLRQQPNTPRRRLRRSTSSLLFSSGAFVLLLLVIALLFMFVIIPSIMSFSSQIFRPNLVKKSWDSLNLVLVLFAIVCGFLGRNTGTTEEDGNSSSVSIPPAEDVVKSIPSTPRQWYEYSDRTAYDIDSSVINNNNRVGSSMRSSSSYPDLRDAASVTWQHERWRFYDDTHVSSHRVPENPDRVPSHHRRRASWHEEHHMSRAAAKNIPVDTYVIRTKSPSSSTPQQSPSPPPSPPPRKSKRTYQAVREKELASSRSESNDDVETKMIITSQKKHLHRPPQSATTSAAFPQEEAENKRGKNNVKKRGVATTKEFLITQLRKKKKKQRQKSVENFETLLNNAASSSSARPLHPPPSPPPPPPLPPPPPPSVFHSLFSSKKPKPKKTHYSAPSPPVALSKSKAQVRLTTTTQKPPLPVKVKNFNVTGEEDNANSGGESPLMSHIPPPPPLPPFRIPEPKFSVHGDFVRINSNDSSRSGSPDLDGEESTSPMSGNESPMRPVFCPSPDVNTKADTFIARFRAGLRLEKMNSVRGRSNLGPDTGDDLGPVGPI